MRKLLIILLALCPAVFGQKSKLIISVSGNDVKEVPDILMDEVSYGLKNNDEYEILGNESFKAALKDGWNNGDIADKRIMELAQKEKADYLCLVKINSTKELGGKYVTAQIYDLKTMSRKDDKIGRRVINNFNDLPHMIEVISDVVADMIGAAKSNSEKGRTDSAFTDPSNGKQPSYQNFTQAERFGTFVLNHALGLGSYLIQENNEGAANILISEALATPLFLLGSKVQMPDKNSYGYGSEYGTDYEHDRSKAVALKYFLLIGGIAFLVLAESFNIYYSFGYDKPKPKATGFIDHRNFRLAMVPSKNGNSLKPGVFYNVKF